jgi:hypothetical protein
VCPPSPRIDTAGYRSVCPTPTPLVLAFAVPGTGRRLLEPSSLGGLGHRRRLVCAVDTGGLRHELETWNTVVRS